MNDRITVHKGEFIIRDSVANEYSLTAAEFATESKLRKFVMLNKISGNKLELRNDGCKKYFSIEDGTIFKYEEKSFGFYRLNLNNFVWEYDQTLASIFYDTYMRYQELVDFEDYYPNSEDLDLSNMRKK